ncbi:MarR family transcriptional regulator [Sphingomonas sp. CCH15-F11]|uniref:MarR family transcriptional regulator n=1 Tax=Sphingomonas sp. CCH15-F11 TaxID=1768785 RepID=UPI0008336B85|nr:MarR family transcriptional regulator [Sphingomonas sp. CCH15-F11]
MTPSELRTLDAIRAYHAEHRIVPTIRELAELLGRSTPSTTHRQVRSLIEQGHLVRAGRTYAERNYALPTKPVAAELTDGELLDEIKRRGGVLAILGLEPRIQGKRGTVIVDEFFDTREHPDG